jgi:O-acetyl-ADP-ribose deacetylase (regulator of RNase III)
VSEIREFLKNNHLIEKVLLVCFGEQAREIHARALQQTA